MRPVALHVSNTPIPVTGRAAELLDAFQQRHLPLTAELADRLAAWEQSQVRSQEPWWGRAYRRAEEALGVPGLYGSSRLWQQPTGDFHLQIVEPILRAAARNTGAVLLNGESDFPAPGPAASEQLRMSAALESFVDRALGQVDVMGRTFWICCALVLHGQALNHARVGSGRRSGQRLMEVDRVLAQLLFVFEPEFEDGHERPRKPRMARTRSERDRTALKPHEGGVAGIVRTNRIEDLDHALISEHMLPAALRMSKLLNEGFLIKHRPPNLKPRRDLLMLVAHDLSELSDSANVVKSGWADAALRISTYLRAQGMADSDLAWTEFRDGQPAAAVLRAGMLAQSDRIRQPNWFGAGRTRGLLQSGLLPDLVDTAAVTSGEPPERSLASLATVAVRSAGNPVLGVGRRRQQDRLSVRNVNDYSRLLLVVVRPGEPGGGTTVNPDWPGLRSTLVDSLRPPSSIMLRAAALYYPAAITPEREFLVVGDAQPGGAAVTVPDATDGAAALQRLTGRISTWFQDLAVEALHS